VWFPPKRKASERIVCQELSSSRAHFGFSAARQLSPENNAPVPSRSFTAGSNKMSKKKVLLMGKSGAGKTSMRSIIFANYMARDTMKLSPTLDVEHTHVRFLGNLTLNLWDCGGQYRFYESYFDSQRDTIFRNVEVLIYVFDIDSGDLENDITLFDGILEAMEQGSPDASIFVLIHKMDLVAEEDRERAFMEVSARAQFLLLHLLDSTRPRLTPTPTLFFLLLLVCSDKL